MEPQNSHFTDDSVDFKRYLSLFISNWYWFAIALLISISIAYGINRWSEEEYSVSSSILIKNDKLGDEAGITNIFSGSGIFKSQQNLKNEIGILKSFSLNYRVMKKLPSFHVDYVGVGKRSIVESRQYRNSPFIVRYDSLEKQILGKTIFIRILSAKEYLLEINGDIDFKEPMSFGTRFNKKGFDFVIDIRDRKNFVYNENASNKYYFYFISPFSLANEYRNKLSVKPIELDASLVTLATTGFEPEQEADYLNQLMEQYIDQGMEFKNQIAESTLGFIDRQLGFISDSLNLAESDLEHFKLKNKIVEISRDGMMMQNRLEKTENEKAVLSLQVSYYDYLKDYIDSKKRSADIVSPTVMGVTDQLLIGLVKELAQLQQEKEKLVMNYEDNSGPLQFIESEIIKRRSAISENIESGRLALDRSLLDVDTRISQVEDEIRKLPSTERQMINIQRKYDINNTVYTFLLEKRAEAGIAKASNVPDNKIIDPAYSLNSFRIRPKEKQNLLIALILGLFLPIIGIVLIDYFNNKIIDKKDIEKGTNAPVLGFISHNSFKTELPVLEKPGSSLSESFRSVRTNLKYFLKGTKCPVISVSSTISSEGKTFLSSNLAIILANLGKRVLLVGLDLRKPRIHKIFGVENNIGMSTFLCGQNKFDDIIVDTMVENLFYATAGPVPPNPAELIESNLMTDFINTAKEKFDYIIIDTPPIAVVTDALLVSSLTDFYLFVVRQRYTSKNTLTLIEDLYKNENIKSLGIVINDINLSGYYGYGLRYGYSMGYGYAYGYNYYGKYSNRYGYSDKEHGYYSDK